MTRLSNVELKRRLDLRKWEREVANLQERIRIQIRRIDNSSSANPAFGRSDLSSLRLRLEIAEGWVKHLSDELNRP